MDTATVIVNLLQLGVPTTIVAKAFNADELEIKGLQADLRVHHYGSSEIAELLQGLMFLAYEQAKNDILNGTPTIKTRMVALVLGKGLALVGKQSPEEFERLRADMGALFVDMKTGDLNSPGLRPDDEFSPSDVEVDAGDEGDDET